MGPTTGGEQQVESGMIIEQREWMTAPGRCFEIALEVDLPEFVGLGMFKALPGGGQRRGRRLDQAMAVQHRRYGAWRGHIGMAQFAQPRTDLAPAPGRMRLPQRQDGLLHLCRGAAWRGLRTTRMIAQAGLTLISVALEQFVGRCRANGEAAA